MGSLKKGPVRGMTLRRPLRVVTARNLGPLPQVEAKPSSVSPTLSGLSVDCLVRRRAPVARQDFGKTERSPSRGTTMAPVALVTAPETVMRV